jgi:sigma-54 dependent transcriptional regulator, flagellar regulatory protein
MTEILLYGSDAKSLEGLAQQLRRFDLGVHAVDGLEACIESMDSHSPAFDAFVCGGLNATDAIVLRKHILSLGVQLPMIGVNTAKRSGEFELPRECYCAWISEAVEPDAWQAAWIAVDEWRDAATFARLRPLLNTLIGTSASMTRVREVVLRVAASESSVLVLGESGTGKEIIAQNIHELSPRWQGPFVPLNCGAIPGELLESEMFGHEKGAFTGAHARRAGRFELAEGGTLFLDEIGDMPLEMQVKLLRVLQERTYQRVGGTQTLTADVRIVAATHRDLEQRIEQGTFREDLFYRLNVIPIEVPPLRERGSDVALLLEDLMQQARHEQNIKISFEAQAMSSLMSYEWPGNVRELANLFERLVVLSANGIVSYDELPERYKRRLSNDEIEPLDDSLAWLNGTHNIGSADPEPAQRDEAASLVHELLLPEVHVDEDGQVDLKASVTELEIALIRWALSETNGVTSKAARRLRMNRTTLIEKMRKYALLRSE